MKFETQVDLHVNYTLEVKRHICVVFTVAVQVLSGKRSKLLLNKPQNVINLIPWPLNWRYFYPMWCTI